MMKEQLNKIRLEHISEDELTSEQSDVNKTNNHNELESMTDENE